MNGVSLGDLALSFQSRQNYGRVKNDLQRLSAELTTGITQNLRGVTGGDLGALAGLEHSIGGLAAYRTATAEAALTSGTMQRTLEAVQNSTTDLAPALLQAAGSGQSTLVEVAAVDARNRFASVVSALNTQVAGRSILGGTATDGPSLASAEAMLADLVVAVSGETTAAGIEAAVENWFDAPGGGFETSGYLGGTQSLAPIRIGPTETASLDLRADDPVLRDLMKSYAMAALVADDALTIGQSERTQLLDAAGRRMLSVDKPMAELRAGVGVIEAQIDDATARNSAETSALEMARSELIGIDPFKSATDLAAVQTQLETLYALTSRLSRLSLVEYLR